MNARRNLRWVWPAAGALVLVFLAAGPTGCKRESAAAVSGSPTKAAPAETRPDVVLVTIDTLRSDAPGFAGNHSVQTPTLDRLAAQGVVFPNAHAHNVITLPSHVNILTGLYPYQHGVRENAGFRLGANVPTLATLLKEKGYATGAFVGAFPLDSRFGLNRGFDVYDDRYPRGGTGSEFEIPERPAADVVAAARAWFDGAAGTPRFLWVHLYDCHEPYRPPAPFDAQYKKTPYFGEVAAVDAALAPLLDPLLGGGAPPTLVVVTADHGESLGEHGEDTHSLFAYEATLKIPLVVWFGGRAAPAVDGRLARHADIAPTIAAATGVARQPLWPGASLLAPAPQGPEATSYFEAFSAAYNYGWAPLRGVIDGNLKYIDLPLPELYDLSADPSELTNRLASGADDVRRLRGRIPEDSAIGRTAQAGVTAGEAARLRSLGYLSGGAAVRASYTADDDPKRLVGINREFYRCIELYQAGDLRGATELARKVVRERPTMVLASVNLAFLLRRGGDTAAALEVYRTAIARGIANEELRKNYGLALCEAGRPAEAVQVLKPFASSDDPSTLNALGIALADAGKSAEAQGVFEGALRIDPEDTEAQENLGITLLRAENLAGARDCFRKTLAIDPRTPRAWNGLGVALARLGDDRGAIDSWSRAVALDPTMYDALYNLGLTAARAGLTDDARQALQRFVSGAPPARYGADIQKARGVLKSLGNG